MDTDIDRDTEQWRGKYFDSLKELESRERQWGELETLLRRSMSRLTLLGDGVDAQLDRLLERFRNSVREERDHGRIRGMVDEITQRAEQVEAKANPPGASTGEDVLRVLEQLSDQFPFPEDLRRKVKAYRRRIDKHPQAEPADSLIEDLIALVAEAMPHTTAASPPKAKSGGMFGRLFGDSGDSQPATESEARPAAVADPDQGPTGVAAAVLLHLLSRMALPAGRAQDADRLRQKIAAARRQAELESLAEGLAGWFEGASVPDSPAEAATAAESSTPSDAAASTLLRLVQSLDLPTELNEQADAIKAELAEAQDDAGIAQAIAAVADLVAALRADAERERREIEEFLARLTERLRELDTGLDEAGRSRAESLAGTMELHNSVGSQVRDIEQGVREADDLESLKQSVQTRLDAILDHMTRHREAEQARHRQAEAQIKALKSHARELEQESESLRETVHATRELALRDGLTGLYNRRAYEDRLAEEFARWARHGAPLSVVVWDLDHFKRINDEFGHQAGDKVLRVLGRILRDGLRASDYSARYGGEEFVSLLPETGAEAALTLADKIRELVGASDFQGGGGHVSVTLSAGIAQAGEADSPEALIERADQALYQAKQEGRNRCRIG